MRPTSPRARVRITIPPPRLGQSLVVPVLQVQRQPAVRSEDAERGLRFVRHQLRRPRRPEDELGPDLTDPLDRGQERTDLVLDQRSDRTPHRGEAVTDIDVPALVHVNAVNEAEVDDVDTELGVVDLRQCLQDPLAEIAHGSVFRRNGALRLHILLVHRIAPTLVVRSCRPFVRHGNFGTMLASTIPPLPPRGPMAIRALIVADHPVTREGLRTALELSEDAVVVVGEAGSGEEAIEQARELAPDVVFMDVRMPGMDGIEATRRIREASPETKVILITIDESRGAISEAIQAGVSGYLLKDASADALVDAAQKAVEGGAVIHPQLTRTFIDEVRMGEGDAVTTAPLSKREREILQKVANGATTKEVAHDLGISPHTVKTHLERIFEKLGANDRAQAVAIAIRTGLVQ